MITELMYVPIAGTSSVRVYDIETMALINTFFQSCNIAYFDMTYDSNNNLQNTAVDTNSSIQWKSDSFKSCLVFCTLF
jgi:hypothetical protein